MRSLTKSLVCLAVLQNETLAESDKTVLLNDTLVVSDVTGLKNCTLTQSDQTVLQSGKPAESNEKKYKKCKPPVKFDKTAIQMIRYDRHANGTECKKFDNLIFKMRALLRKRKTFSRISRIQSQSL